MRIQQRANSIPRSTRSRLTVTTLEGRDCPTVIYSQPTGGDFSLSVEAVDNIYGSGHAVAPAPEGHGAGRVPTPIRFAAGAGKFITFPSVTGSVTCSTVNPYPYNDAEGTKVASGDTNIRPQGGISGTIHTNRGFYLIGVFLTENEPRDPAPAALTFSDPETFSDLFPSIGQTFFIGDGKVDGSNALQRFHAPADATRLCFGFADSWFFGNPVGSPGWYEDNGGSIAVQGKINTLTLISDPVATQTVAPDGSGLPVAEARPTVAVGGNGRARLINNDQSVRLATTPFPGYSGDVRVASADFNRDGVADLVVGTGPGTKAQVRVLDGVTQGELFSLAPFEDFTGGVYVAAGDVTGDGIPDLAITPDEGGGPRVRLFSGAGFPQIADFFGIDDPAFRGGARATLGDIDGDGIGDLIVAAGFGGGPRVAGFSGSSLRGTPQKLFADFLAFEPTLRNGIYAAVGDVDADGKADLIAGGGPGGGPRVTIFDGNSLKANAIRPTANFLAGDADNRGGVRVAAKDLDGDSRAEVIVGAGVEARAQVTGYTIAGVPKKTSFDFDALPGFNGGVYVG